MLILRYSEFIDLYSKEERQEFLFRIFKHICISGDYEKVNYSGTSIQRTPNIVLIERPVSTSQRV